MELPRRTGPPRRIIGFIIFLRLIVTLSPPVHTLRSFSAHEFHSPDLQFSGGTTPGEIASRKCAAPIVRIAPASR